MPEERVLVPSFLLLISKQSLPTLQLVPVCDAFRRLLLPVRTFEHRIREADADVRFGNRYETYRTTYRL